MVRRSAIAVVVVLLLATALIVHLGSGGAPLGLMLKYGLDPSCKPTGRTRNVMGHDFVEIGPGAFLMGSNRNGRLPDLLGKVCGSLGLAWGDQGKLSNEMPVHVVEFRRGYWIAKCEVTNEQYERYDANHERSEFSLGDSDPVVDVSGQDAKDYCDWLAEKTGLPVRLPTESEWEAACRGGSRAEFCFGDDTSRLGSYAWYLRNSVGLAHEVGTRSSNSWGLCDMHGNAWEWCEDDYETSYVGSPIHGSARTPQSSDFQVVRGGNWKLDTGNCRSAARDFAVPGLWSGLLGFRPAFFITPGQEHLIQP